MCLLLIQVHVILSESVLHLTSPEYTNCTEQRGIKSELHSDTSESRTLQRHWLANSIPAGI